jgi:gas vesicle protein
MEMDERSSPIAWFVMGAVTGATIACLLAPKSGAELREDIALAMDDGLERGSRAARGVARAARQGVSAVEDAIGSLGTGSRRRGRSEEEPSEARAERTQMESGQGEPYRTSEGSAPREAL